MNRIAIICACLGLSLVGCGEEPTFTVAEEPPGDNCPTGGFRIEADGEVFYSCDETQEVRTAHVAAGADGNPCVGDALLVTLTLEDGTTRDAYTCQPVEVDPTGEALLSGVSSLFVAMGEAQCVCGTPEEQASCQAEVDFLGGVLRYGAHCRPEVLAIAGPIPEGGRAYAECVVDAYEQIDACLSELDTLECSPEREAALEECQSLGEQCGEPSEELGAWANNLQTISDFVQCPIMPGY